MTTVYGDDHRVWSRLHVSRCLQMSRFRSSVRRCRGSCKKQAMECILQPPHIHSCHSPKKPEPHAPNHNKNPGSQSCCGTSKASPCLLSLGEDRHQLKAPRIPNHVRQVWAPQLKMSTCILRRGLIAPAMLSLFCSTYDYAAARSQRVNRRRKRKRKRRAPQQRHTLRSSRSAVKATTYLHTQCTSI